jgi:hypothetical protein
MGDLEIDEWVSAFISGNWLQCICKFKEAYLEQRWVSKVESLIHKLGGYA